jgi:hypothetical protein
MRQVAAAEAVRESEVVLDASALCSLPARRVAFDDRCAQTLGCSVDRCGEPGRAGADHHEVVQRRLGTRAQPESVGDLHHFSATQDGAVGQQHDRERVVVAGEECEKAMRLGVALELQPHVRDMVAGEEHPGLVAAFRPSVADDAHAVESVRVLGLPIVEQIVDDRVQAIVGWRPRLQQVVVEPDLVDGLDRHVGVGIRGEQNELCAGDLLLRTAQQLDASHLRHAMVGHDQRHRLIALGELGEHHQRLRPRRRPHHPIPLVVARTQVASDGLRDRSVVVDCENDRCGHETPGGSAPSGGAGRDVTTRWCG